MLNKVLVAVDGSENSLRAAKYAVGLAEMNPGLQVTLIHIGPKCADLFTTPGVCAWITEQELEKHVQTHLDATSEKLLPVFEAAGLKPEIIGKSGDPAYEICEFAREGGFDLVIIGSRGFSTIKGLALGSVSHKVIQLCPVNVLIIK